jgi:fibronectin type 3 domain-containing protein
MTTVSLRQAVITWTAPTKNTDGTAVTLSGYKVYYGTASQNYSQTVSVSGASTVQRTVALSGPGTWYFAVTALDNKGAESAKSNEVSKVIP